MTFSIIVAADRSNGIGLNGQMPWPRLKADLAHFKQLTMGHAVIMGRRTWDSLPASVRPLPGRENMVVSRAPSLRGGAYNARSFDEAVAFAPRMRQDRTCDTFVIGGGQIHAIALAHPACGDVWLTRIDADYACDTFLPPLDGFECAEVISEHDHIREPVPYRIERWRRG